MISIEQVEQALDVVGSYDDKLEAIPLDGGGRDLFPAGRMIARFKQRERLHDDRWKAQQTIRQAQMERAWPMLAHLDIYRWPA